MREHLDAHHQEHHGQCMLHVVEGVQRPGQGEIERAEPEDREHVAREHEEGIRGDGEDGGNRVDGEHEIRRLDHHERRRQRRQHPPETHLLDHRIARPVLSCCRQGGHFVRRRSHEEVLAVEPRRQRQESPHQPDRAVLFRIAGLDTDERHLHSRQDEDDSKEGQNPREFRHEPGPNRDHRAAHRQGAQDSPEEHAMLVYPGNAEGAEQHRDDEHVVGAQRQLDHVAGEELQQRRPCIIDLPIRVKRAAVNWVGLEAQPQPVVVIAEVDEAREGQGRHDPDDGPGQRFAHGDDVRAAMEDAEIERQQNEDEEKETNPHEHHGPPGTRGSLAGFPRHSRERRLRVDDWTARGCGPLLPTNASVPLTETHVNVDGITRFEEKGAR